MGNGHDPDRRIRIADTDREHAAQLLQQAMGEGRISMAEFEERAAVVYAAQYADELHGPFADLPIGPGTDGVARPGSGPLARSGSAPDRDDERAVLATRHGTLRRRGRWVVPSRLAVEVASGSVILDCTQAELPPVVDIAVTVKSGTVKVIVGPGVSADINGVRTSSGSARTKVDAVRDPRRPHFVVHGTVGSGTVVVRRPLFS